MTRFILSKITFPRHQCNCLEPVLINYTFAADFLGVVELRVYSVAQRPLPSEQWLPVGGLGGLKLPPEIPKVLQNRAKLNPIVKTVKNC